MLVKFHNNPYGFIPLVIWNFKPKPETYKKFCGEKKMAYPNLKPISPYPNIYLRLQFPIQTPPYTV